MQQVAKLPSGSLVFLLGFDFDFDSDSNSNSASVCGINALRASNVATLDIERVFLVAVSAASLSFRCGFELVLPQCSCPMLLPKSESESTSESCS